MYYVYTLASSYQLPSSYQLVVQITDVTEST